MCTCTYNIIHIICTCTHNNYILRVHTYVYMYMCTYPVCAHIYTCIYIIMYAHICTCTYIIYCIKMYMT